MTAHLLHLPVTGKHHESKRVLKLLVIRSADRDLCIIRKYNALMTVSTYSMKINGKAVMAETEIWFHSFCKSCQSFFCCICSCSGIDRGLPQISFQIKNIGAEHLIIAEKYRYRVCSFSSFWHAVLRARGRYFSICCLWIK